MEKQNGKSNNPGKEGPEREEGLSHADQKSDNSDTVAAQKQGIHPGENV